MGTRSYENFDLLIEAEEGGRYRARVTNCPVGDTPASVFSLPFSPTELENLLLKLDPGRSGMRRIADRHTQASIDLGSGLFDAVFCNEVLVAWSRSKDAVRQEGHGLRLRLRLTAAPSLAAMPWELLYDKSSRMFCAQSDRTPVVRYLDVTNPPRPLTVRGPLRILAIIASPHGLPRLDVEREWATICDALDDKQRVQLVHVDRLPAPTISELQRWLRHNEVHVLHFVGHGCFDDRLQDGMLMFTDSSGRAAPISSAVLGTHVRDHDPLRLVVLNACQTARADDADPYSGMAQGLIQQEAAAVVAMQFPISDDAAIVFTREFYGAVADGEPLDQAMASTRKALLADHAAEWATPVLFLRAADGRVFDRVRGPEAVYRATTTADPAQNGAVVHRPAGESAGADGGRDRCSLAFGIRPARAAVACHAADTSQCPGIQTPAAPIASIGAQTTPNQTTEVGRRSCGARPATPPQAVLDRSRGRCRDSRHFHCDCSRTQPSVPEARRRSANPEQPRRCGQRPGKGRAQLQ